MDPHADPGWTHPLMRIRMRTQIFFNVAPDPTFHPDADPDLHPDPSFEKRLKLLKKC